MKSSTTALPLRQWLLARAELPGEWALDPVAEMGEFLSNERSKREQKTQPDLQLLGLPVRGLTPEELARAQACWRSENERIRRDHAQETSIWRGTPGNRDRKRRLREALKAIGPSPETRLKLSVKAAASQVARKKERQAKKAAYRKASAAKRAAIMRTLCTTEELTRDGGRWRLPEPEYRLRTLTWAVTGRTWEEQVAHTAQAALSAANRPARAPARPPRAPAAPVLLAPSASPSPVPPRAPPLRSRRPPTRLTDFLAAYACERQRPARFAEAAEVAFDADLRRRVGDVALAFWCVLLTLRGEDASCHAKVETLGSRASDLRDAEARSRGLGPPKPLSRRQTQAALGRLKRVGLVWQSRGREWLIGLHDRSRRSSLTGDTIFVQNRQVIGNVRDEGDGRATVVLPRASFESLLAAKAKGRPPKAGERLSARILTPMERLCRQEPRTELMVAFQAACQAALNRTNSLRGNAQNKESFGKCGIPNSSSTRSVTPFSLKRERECEAASSTQPSPSSLSRTSRERAQTKTTASGIKSSIVQPTDERTSESSRATDQSEQSEKSLSTREVQRAQVTQQRIARTSKPSDNVRGHAMNITQIAPGASEVSLPCFHQLRDVVAFLIELGVSSEDVTIYCEQLKDVVPLLSRIENIADRVHRTLLVMEGA